MTKKSSIPHITLVEDDKLLGSLYTEILERLPSEVTLCSSALELYEEIEKSSFTTDLLLLDMMLPYQDGLQVLRQFQSNPRFLKKNLSKIVLLTNLSSPGITHQALELGAVKVWIKSEMNPRQLLDAIKELLFTSVNQLES